MKHSGEFFSCETCPNKAHSPLGNVIDASLGEIDLGKSCVYFKKGQMLLHEGNKPGGLYCIRTGKLKLSRMGYDGKEQIIRFAKDGDLIGYRSLLSGESISASVTILEDTHACYLPKSMVFEMIEKNPKFSLELMKLACHELGEASKIITNLAQKSVRERLAEVLLILRETFGENEEGELDIALTREEIANMVGTATESVIRLLSEFKDDDLIEIHGRRLALKNVKELAHVGKVYD